MVSSVSSAGSYLMLQTSVGKIRTQLADAQTELGSGKPSDYGLALGARTDVLVGMQQQQNLLQSISQTNGIVSSRLDTTSTALGSLLTAAQDFMQLAIQNSPAAIPLSTLRQQAQAGLTTMRGLLNSTIGGRSVFGGENTDQLVLSQDPQASGSIADAAFQASFTNAFGMGPASPGVSTISAAQVNSYLSGSFASMFDAAGWKSNFSAASDQSLRGRIGISQTVDTSVSGNEPAFAQLAQAFSTLAALPIDQMGSDAASRVISKAASLASSAVEGLTALQTRVGLLQKSVVNATQVGSVQIESLTRGIEALDPIDPYATSTRLTELTTQLQTAYTLTSQMQKLSLAQYL